MQITERPTVYKEYKKVSTGKFYTALLKVHLMLRPSRLVQSNTVSHLWEAFSHAAIYA